MFEWRVLKRVPADPPPGVYALDPANPRLPAAGVLAVLAGAPALTVEHIGLLAAIDLAGLDEHSRVVALQLWARAAACVAGHEQAALAAVAGPAPQTEDDWTREEVAAALHLAPATAQSQIDRARALTGRLSATGAALRAGRPPYWHAAHLADQLEDRTDQVAAAVQVRVLARADGKTYPQFRRLVRETLAAVDPQTAAERHAAAAAQRDVAVWDLPDGIAQLVATGPAPAVYSVAQAIGALARAAKAPGDERTAGARRFDTLIDLLAAGSDATYDASGTGVAGGRAVGGPPTGQGRPLKVGLLIDLPTAVGLAEHPAELAGYGPIPAPVARALAADAEWTAFVLDAVQGHLESLGSVRYRPSQALRDLVVARDRTCRHPGCAWPAEGCDIDHGIPRDQGGCTDRVNCGALCRRHHRLKTHTDWRIRRDADGTVTWRSAAGLTHRVPLPDYRWITQPPDPPPEPAVQPDAPADVAPAGPAPWEPADTRAVLSVAPWSRHAGLGVGAGRAITRPRTWRSERLRRLLVCGVREQVEQWPGRGSLKAARHGLVGVLLDDVHMPGVERVERDRPQRRCAGLEGDGRRTAPADGGELLDQVAVEEQPHVQVDLGPHLRRHDGHRGADQHEVEALAGQQVGVGRRMRAAVDVGDPADHHWPEVARDGA
jgi:hypothetical protein